MKKNTVKNMVLSAMFIAVGLLLPMLTANLTELGSTLCPMHLPVLICGAVCGWQWGMAVGFITPLLRSLLFHAPIIYPTAISMAFELAAYGLVIGLLLKLMSGKSDRLAGIYISLTLAMIIGRIILGAANFALLGIKGQTYTWELFVTAAFVKAVPAIVLQYAIVPPIVYAFGKNSKRR